MDNDNGDPCPEGFRLLRDELRPLINVAAVPAFLGGRNLRLYKRPFLVGQVAGITQLAAVVTLAVLESPHR